MKKVLATAAAVVLGLTLGAVAQPQTTAQAAKYHQGMPKALRGHWILPKSQRWKIGREAGSYWYYLAISNQKFELPQIDTVDTYLAPRYRETSKNHYTVLTHYRLFSTITKNMTFKDKRNVKINFTLKNGRMSLKGNSSIAGLWYARTK